MKKAVLTLVLLATAALLCAGASLATGTTTSSMRGIITDASGYTLPGAMVTASHLPTNSLYSTISSTDGTYRLRMLRVGGPYTVTVTIPGFQKAVRDNIMLSLGESKMLNFQLQLSTGE